MSDGHWEDGGKVWISANSVASPVIKELKAEIERLKAALQQIAHDKTEIGYAQHIARAALEGKP